MCRSKSQKESLEHLFPCVAFEFAGAAKALRTMEVTGRYIPPPPVFFRKDIIPWGLLAHLSQGYHSKWLLGGPVEFGGNRCAPSFCRSRSYRSTRKAGADQVCS